MFSDQAKLKCIERELALRRNVYPKWVAQGKMTQAAAEKEIQTLEDIANDYRGKISASLFAAG
jgi:hypothetical protein